MAGAMSALEIVSQLTAFQRRGAGSDAERRAARWLADQLSGTGTGTGTSRDVQVEPFWCRPNWALAHAWHAALALAGSLVSVSAPRVGIALLIVALVSIVADALTGVSPGRRLTPERASQNVIAVAGQHEAAETHLILTANYDAGRTGLLGRDRLRGLTAKLSRGPLALGWLGWLCLAIVWLLAVAVLRVAGQHGTAIGLLQLPPTVGLVLTVALLLEHGLSDAGPGATDNATGVAVAISLLNALAAAPPRHLTVELVLHGAGDSGGIGLRRYLRSRRRELRPANAVVLGIAACRTGTPRWWTGDGPLLPLRYSGQIKELCEGVAEQESHLAARPHRGRGSTPALEARYAGFPATTIGCLEDPRARARAGARAGALPERLDRAALDQATQFGLILVDAVDAYLGRRGQPAVPTPA